MGGKSSRHIVLFTLLTDPIEVKLIGIAKSLTPQTKRDRGEEIINSFEQPNLSSIDSIFCSSALLKIMLDFH